MVNKSGSPAPNIPTIACLIVLILTSLLVCYVVYDTVKRAREISKSDGEESVAQVYEDEDGVATEESQKHYSVSISKWITLSSTGAGLFTSVVIALLMSLPSFGFHADTIDYWLALGTWVGNPL